MSASLLRALTRPTAVPFLLRAPFSRFNTYHRLTPSLLQDLITMKGPSLRRSARFQSSTPNAKDTSGSNVKIVSEPSPGTVKSASRFATGWGPISWLLANKARMSTMAKEYGYFVIATYFGIYVLTLGGIYLSVKTGLVQGPDAEGLNTFINGWFVKRAVMGDSVVTIPPAFADLATAWVLCKMTEPVRLVATLAVVPTLAKRLPPSFMLMFGVKKVMDGTAKP